MNPRVGPSRRKAAEKGVPVLLMAWAFVGLARSRPARFSLLSRSVPKGKRLPLQHSKCTYNVGDTQHHKLVWAMILTWYTTLVRGLLFWGQGGHVQEVRKKQKS